MDKFQREVLWLLHTICANTSSDESLKQDHLNRANAYFEGITSFYAKLDNELSEECQNETRKILFMFDVLTDNLKLISDEEVRSKLTFKGFHGSDLKRIEFVKMLKENKEFDRLNLDSHGQYEDIVRKYLKMLEIWERVRDDLSESNLNKLATAFDS